MPQNEPHAALESLDAAMGAGHALSRDDLIIGLQVAGVGLGRVDYETDQVVVDGLTARMFDLPPGAPVPRSDLHARIHPEDWPVVASEVEHLLDPDRPDIINLSHRVVTGTGTRWVQARKRVWFDGEREGARPQRGVFAVVDITDRRQAEIRSEVLLRELNHRGKNLITMVTVMARQLGRHGAGDVLPRLEERLQALARNQDVILHGVGGTFELAAVIRRQLEVLGETVIAQVDLSGATLQLDPMAAQTLAMVVHELMTNSLKHGALSVTTGRVRVAWSLSDTGRFTFEWIESGGPAVATPQTTGFGTQILTRLAEVSLSGEARIEFEPAGLVYRLTAPVASVLA